MLPRYNVVKVQRCRGLISPLSRDNIRSFVPKIDETPDPVLATLPERIAFARKESGLGCRALDRASGLAGGATTRLEKGEKLAGVTALKILKMARALGVRPEWLLTGSAPMRDDGEWILIQRTPALLELLRHPPKEVVATGTRRK